MFGSGGPFGSMFGTDPFFTDPFSVMNSMFSDPFFANPLGVGFRPPGPQYAQTNQSARARQPVIEEVDDAGDTGRAARAQDQPIVEEPDDEPSPRDRASQRQRRHSPPRQQHAAQAPTAPMDPFSQLFGALAGAGSGLGGGGGSSFMISSSSYSSMGPGGVSYSASSTTRMGPGGVRETQSVVRDGRSGTESVTISRGLGDGRQRTLVRTRDAITGREEQLEDLQGLGEHEADTFDDQWRNHAERNLPGGGAFGAAVPRHLGGGSRGAGQQQRPLALPAATAGAGNGAGTTGLYDSNAGLAAAQRATYVRPPSPAGGRVRQHSGGAGGATASGHYGAGGAAYGAGAGAQYGAGGGSTSSRSRGGSVLDVQVGGQQYGSGVRQQQQQQQSYARPPSPGVRRMPSGSGSGGGVYGAGYGGDTARDRPSRATATERGSPDRGASACVSTTAMSRRCATSVN